MLATSLLVVLPQLIPFRWLIKFCCGCSKHAAQNGFLHRCTTIPAFQMQPQVSVVNGVDSILYPNRLRLRQSLSATSQQNIWSRVRQGYPYDACSYFEGRSTFARQILLQLSAFSRYLHPLLSTTTLNFIRVSNNLFSELQRLAFVPKNASWWPSCFYNVFRSIIQPS